MKRRHAITLEERAVKLDVSVQNLMSAAIDYAATAKDATKMRWMKNEARVTLIRAAVKHANAIQRARKDRGR